MSRQWDGEDRTTHRRLRMLRVVAGLTSASPLDPRSGDDHEPYACPVCLTPYRSWAAMMLEGIQRMLAEINAAVPHLDFADDAFAEEILAQRDGERCWFCLSPYVATVEEDGAPRTVMGMAALAVWIGRRGAAFCARDRDDLGDWGPRTVPASALEEGFHRAALRALREAGGWR